MFYWFGFLIIQGNISIGEVRLMTFCIMFFELFSSMTDSRWQNVKYKTKCKELGSVVSKYNMTNHFLDPFYTRICILCECQAKNTSYGVNEMFLSCTSHSSFTIDVMKCIPIPIKYVQFSLCLFIQFIHFEI